MNTPFTAIQLHNLLNLIPANIYWEDTEGKMLGANLPMLKVLNMTHLKQIVGIVAYDLIPPPLINAIKSADDYVKQNQEVLVLQEHGFNSLGHETTYLSKKAPLLGRFNQLCGIIGVSIDLGVVKSSYEQRALLEKFSDIVFIN